MVWVIGIGVGLLLLFTFPRQMGMLVGLIALGIAGVALYMWSQAEHDKAERGAVAVTVSRDKACPTSSAPLHVVFGNSSGKTVESVGFTIVGKRSGYSREMVSNYETWDKIMKPGEAWGWCWPTHDYDFKAADAALADQWSVTLTSVRFE